MEFAQREVQLKDGRTAILRAPRAGDAAALIEFMKINATETRFLALEPDEFQLTIEQEEDFLRGKVDDARGAMILALVDGEHAGNCAFSGVNSKRRYLHRCSIAIALYQKYWGLGLGRQLMACALELAKSCGYEQMELEVVADNVRAQKLYASLGFSVYGRHARDLKYEDGSYADVLLMTKEL